MKTDFFKRNQRALTMLMFGSAVIVARPLSINAQNVTNTAQRTTVHQAVSGIVNDASGQPVIGASKIGRAHV